MTVELFLGCFYYGWIVLPLIFAFWYVSFIVVERRHGPLPESHFLVKLNRPYGFVIKSVYYKVYENEQDYKLVKHDEGFPNRYNHHASVYAYSIKARSSVGWFVFLTISPFTPLINILSSAVLFMFLITPLMKMRLVN